jgi:PAS domain S-box-containing protein
MKAKETMMKNSGNHSEDSILREKVKEFLKKKPVKTASSNAGADVLKLMHELEVHQVELELINEELTRAKEDAEVAREKYIGLFDFAPSGYFILTRKGKITELNLSGANMLGKNRSQLKNSLFGFFVSNETKPVFNLFLEKVFSGKAKESCEISLLTDVKLPVYVHLTGILNEKSEQCFVTAVDITGRKKAEEAIQKGKERFTKAFRSIPDALIISRMEDGKIVEVNNSWQKVFGYSNEESIGQSSLTLNLFANPADRQRSVALLQKQRFVRDYELQIRQKSGALRTAILSAELLEIQGEQYILTVVEDITERKHAEEALRISLEKYRVLFESFPLGITITDKSGKIVETNHRSERLLGISREAQAKRKYDGKEWVLVQTDGTIMPADEYASVIALQENRLVENVEMGVVKDDGDITWINVTAAPIPLEGYGVAITYGDITERKLMEEALQIALERLDLALQSSKAGSWDWNIATGNVVWSAHMFDLFGLDPQTTAASFESWHTALHPDDREIASNRMDRALKQHSDLNIDFRVILPGGQIRWINAIGKGIYDDHGHPVQMIGICLDITKRKLTEKLIRDLARFPEENVNPVCRISKEGELLYFNPAARKIIPALFPETAGKIPEQWIKKIKEIYHSDIRQTEELEIDGKIYSFEMIPVVKGGYINMYGTDITKRKQAEKELKNAVKQLKQLYLHQEEIKENERKAASREIHDELGQLLTALKIDIGWINDNIENNAEVKKRIEGMNDIADETLEIVQRIASDLRPGLLDDLGLVPSIEWYCQKIEKRTGIKCIFKSDDVHSSNNKINLALYRILQEALTNVIRHANANKVNINLCRSENSIVMEIIDDGIGITREKIESCDSLGLIGIGERVKQFNGSLDLTSARNEGTKLRVIIPQY